MLLERIRAFLLGMYSFMVLFGVDPLKTLRTLRGLPFYVRHYITFRRQQSQSAVSFPFGKLYPCLENRSELSGTAGGHYFHQDLLIARKIFENNPAVHVDVGSRIDGFVAHVASYRSIEVIDVRPLENKIPNVKFIRCDMMDNPPDFLIDYCDSLSCLHALEHFGLGRYGDDINYDGHVTGFENIRKILKHGGKLYFSVPIGPSRIEFNAHRVFSIDYLLGLINPGFRIDSFSFVNDEGNLFQHVELTKRSIENNCDCNYGCGIFELTRIG